MRADAGEYTLFGQFGADGSLSWARSASRSEGCRRGARFHSLAVSDSSPLMPGAPRQNFHQIRNVRHPMCYGRFWRVEIGRKGPKRTNARGRCAQIRRQQGGSRCRFHARTVRSALAPTTHGTRHRSNLQLFAICRPHYGRPSSLAATRS